MSIENDLGNKSCEPCRGQVLLLASSEYVKLQAKLHPDWALDSAGKSLTRKFIYKGFAKAVYTANLAAFLAGQQGHHPDVSFGWGYCTVTFTTHDIDGLSENDFICAAKFDRMVAG
ncbi:MAG: 4a-hydroxytetrahydrobiopterin dehydratase [Rhodobacteraceae bacterium]|nr:4a-hydroxytetrahydrobiopterin dehydratase [Paracoccaceae bacterium]